MGFGPLDKTHSVIYTDGTLKSVVTVAQSAELWIVAPAVVGSSPIGHPSLKTPKKSYDFTHSFAALARLCLPREAAKLCLQKSYDSTRLPHWSHPSSRSVSDHAARTSGA